MTVATDAYLCFGVEIDDESLPWMQEEWDFDLYEWETRYAPDWLRVVQHCSESTPMYIIAIKDTVITAHRGDAQSVKLSENQTYLRICHDRIATFCNDHGITMYREPEYLLCSYWEV